MNCKPGELARIVRGKLIDQHLIGTTVRLKEVSQREPHVCWSYEGPRLMTCFGEVKGLADDTLEPVPEEETTA